MIRDISREDMEERTRHVPQEIRAAILGGALFRSRDGNAYRVEAPGRSQRSVADTSRAAPAAPAAPAASEPPKVASAPAENPLRAAAGPNQGVLDRERWARDEAERRERDEADRRARMANPLLSQATNRTNANENPLRAAMKKGV